MSRCISQFFWIWRSNIWRFPFGRFDLFILYMRPGIKKGVPLICKHIIGGSLCVLSTHIAVIGVVFLFLMPFLILGSFGGTFGFPLLLFFG